jgi:predicted AAA+ superfamily ATPase
MEKLFEKALKKIKSTSLKFKRYLFDEIDWNDRLIGIKGARGTGKTTLMIQKLKSVFSDNYIALYISMDDIYFSANKLIDFTDTFVKNGGKFLFIDEVHKYKNWSQELKNIYDDHPELSIVFTSSSALEIHKGEYDLSRRAIIYNLHELSLREYINLSLGMQLPVFSLKDILEKHIGLSSEINLLVKPIVLFNEFIQYGAYPFINEGKTKYYERLETIINLIIEIDLQSITDIEYQTILKIKKLLFIISGIVPFKPNIAELSRKVGTTRDVLLKYLNYLNRANLILSLHSDTKGISYMAKPEKIFLNNTTLMYALNQNNINLGSIRETFFANQLVCKHTLTYPKKGDFIIDGKYIVEIGGKNKSNEQIKGIPNSFIAADGIEYGFNNKIPLWLFGYLY